MAKKCTLSIKLLRYKYLTSSADSVIAEDTANENERKSYRQRPRNKYLPLCSFPFTPYQHDERELAHSRLQAKNNGARIMNHPRRAQLQTDYEILLSFLSSSPTPCDILITPLLPLLTPPLHRQNRRSHHDPPAVPHHPVQTKGLRPPISIPKERPLLSHLHHHLTHERITQHLVPSPLPLLLVSLLLLLRRKRHLVSPISHMLGNLDHALRPPLLIPIAKMLLDALQFCVGILVNPEFHLLALYLFRLPALKVCAEHQRGFPLVSVVWNKVPDAGKAGAFDRHDVFFVFKVLGDGLVLFHFGYKRWRAEMHLRPRNIGEPGVLLDLIRIVGEHMTGQRIIVRRGQSPNGHPWIRVAILSRAQSSLLLT